MRIEGGGGGGVAVRLNFHLQLWPERRATVKLVRWLSVSRVGSGWGGGLSDQRVVDGRENRARVKIGTLPVLSQCILSFEHFSAYVAREWYVGMRPFVYHKIVLFRKSSLTVLAHVFAFRAHFTPEFTTIVRFYLHNREHFAASSFLV